MQLPRSFVCDREGCNESIVEEKLGSGIPGWGSIQGFQKDGQEVMICPDCVVDLQRFLDAPKTELKKVELLEEMAG